MMKVFFILHFSFLFLLSCLQVQDYNDSNNSGVNSLNRDSESQASRSRGCSSNQLDDEDLSLNRPDIVSSRNAGEYEISGRCSTRDRFVIVSVSGVSQEVDCFGGRWETVVDITSVIQGDEDVSIEVESGSSEVCQTVRNTFNCEDGYVPVSRLVDDRDVGIDYDFCVMKYEASAESGRRLSSRSSSYGDLQRQREEFQEEYSERAVSRSGGEAWTDISIGEARRRCSNNGVGYGLITNEEWQVIARNIELEPLNWFLERTTIESGNYLNPGVPAYGSSRSSSSSRNNNRSHFLVNGEEIFDFGGGVWEMVSDSTSIVKRKTNADNVFELSGDLKRLFGPRRNYSNSVASERGSYTNIRGLGLGGVYLSRVNDIIARGGSEERDIGVFAVRSDISSSRVRDVGFRCVYRP